jgi:hypothetical protein
MFESNFPVDKGTCSYQFLWNTSQADRRRLFRRRKDRIVQWHCDESLPSDTVGPALPFARRAITPRASPVLRTGLWARYRWFESRSLQQRVCELRSLSGGRNENRASAAKRDQSEFARIVTASGE